MDGALDRCIRRLAYITSKNEWIASSASLILGLDTEPYVSYNLP